jgi:hypothetical protein
MAREEPVARASVREEPMTRASVREEPMTRASVREEPMTRAGGAHGKGILIWRDCGTCFPSDFRITGSSNGLVRA